MPFHLAEELMELLGGVLGNDALAQCELLAASESSRVLMADVARALREGRAEAVPRKDSAAFEAMSDELRGVLVALTDPSPGENEGATLDRQVAELQLALAGATELLTQATHRKERAQLLEQASAKSTSIAAYEQHLRAAVAAELAAVGEAEQECSEAVSGLDAAVADLLGRLDGNAPFLLPASSVDELANANAAFLESVQAHMDGSLGGSPTGGRSVSDMRSIALQELQRLQDLFIRTELDRTDALQLKEESLAIDAVAQAQLAQIDGGMPVVTSNLHAIHGKGSAEEAVVGKRNEISSLHKEAEKLRKESEMPLLLQLKASQALPIKEGNYVLRLAEKASEVQRVKDACVALFEHKQRLLVCETFVSSELMGHRQRATAMTAAGQFPDVRT